MEDLTFNGFREELRKIAKGFGKNKDGYDLQGKTNFQGLPIDIENRKGSVRKGKNEDGTEWKTKMKHPYGYVRGTKAVDGDELDVYVGPKKDAPKAFVVHQKDPETKKYDEDKVMLGFKTKAEARRAYLAHYDKPGFLGTISAVAMGKLKEMVTSKKQLGKITDRRGA